MSELVRVMKTELRRYYNICELRSTLEEEFSLGLMNETLL